jgi:hypothetical protein
MEAGLEKSTRSRLPWASNRMTFIVSLMALIV